MYARLIDTEWSGQAISGASYIVYSIPCRLPLTSYIASISSIPMIFQNGDLNWIIDGKIMAFAGPSYKKTISPEGYCTLAPSDYIPYFKKKNVGLVVRLNKKNYDETEFINAGMNHLEQFYLDGSCPPMTILHKVLAEMETVTKGKAFAIHCKAGLGRTGTCIGGLHDETLSIYSTRMYCVDEDLSTRNGDWSSTTLSSRLGTYHVAIR
jgi:hypothetical protein